MADIYEQGQAYLAGLAQSSQDKTTQLQQAKQDKLAQLSNKRDAVLLGLNDGDSPITSEGTIREQATNGMYYDANELPKKGFEADKSSRAMQYQDLLTARKVGKDVANITDQDRLDVANWQQIQKLADIANGPGVWEAPFARGVEKTNLTGRYVDENGIVQNAPLNVPMTISTSGQVDKFGRKLGQVGSVDGVDVTTASANNPQLNARYTKPETATTDAELQRAYAAIAASKSAGTLDRVANISKAMGAMAAGGVYDLADMAVEAAGSVVGKDWDLGTDDEKTKAVDKLFGYDRRFTQVASEEVKNEIARMNEEGLDAKGMWNILKKGISTPEFLGESLGYLAPMLIGGPMSAGGKALMTANRALKVAEAAGDAVAIGKAAEGVKAAREAYTATKQALDFVSKNAGLLGVSAGTTNDDLDKYAESVGISKKDVDPMKVAGTFMGNVVLNSIDKWTDMGILKSPKMREGLIAVVKGMSQKQLGELGSGLAQIGKSAAVSGAKEGSTEYVQTFIEQINQQVGEQAGKTVADAWNNEENKLERATAGALGVTGAQQMDIASIGVSGLKGGVSAGVDKVREVQASKKAEVSEEDKAEINMLRQRFAPQPTDSERIALIKAKINGDKETVDKYRNIAMETLTTVAARDVLGATEDDVKRVQKIEDYVSIIASDQTLTDEQLVQIKANLQEHSGLGEDVIDKAINNGIEEAVAENTLKQSKSMGQVGEEVVTGTRGFVTYYSAAKEAQENNDQETVDKMVDAMDRFAASQRTKLERWEAGEQQARRELQAKIELKVKEGLSVPDAVRAVAKSVGDSGVTVTYGVNDKDTFKWKYKTVLEKMVSKDPNSTPGGYLAMQAVRNELQAMQTLQAKIGGAVTKLVSTSQVKKNTPEQVKLKIMKLKDSGVDTETLIAQINASTVLNDAEKAEMIERIKGVHNTAEIVGNNEPTEEEYRRNAIQDEIAWLESEEGKAERVDDVGIAGWRRELNEAKAALAEASTLEPNTYEQPEEMIYEQPDDVGYENVEEPAYEQVPDVAYESMDADVLGVVAGQIAVDKPTLNEKVVEHTKVWKEYNNKQKEAEKKLGAKLANEEISEDEYSRELEKLEKRRDMLDEVLYNIQEKYKVTLADGVRRLKFRTKAGVGATAQTEISKYVARVTKPTGLNTQIIEADEYYTKKGELLLQHIASPQSGNHVAADDSVDDVGRILLFKDDGTLDYNTVAAMDAALTNYLVESYRDLTTTPTEEDINEMLPGVVLNPDLIEFMEGGIVLRKYEAEKIGAKVMEYLGLSAGSEMTISEAQALKTSLGAITLYLGKAEGLVNNEATYEVSKSKPTPFVKAGDKLRASIMALKDKAEYLENNLGVDIKNKRTYSEDKLNPKRKVEVHNQPYTKVTKVQKEAIHAQEAMAYQKVGTVASTLQELFTVDGKLDVQAILERMGYVDVDKAKREGTMSVDQIAAATAANTNLALELQAYLDMPADKQVYFPWFITKGGRTNIDAIDVAPQTNKQLQRWAVVADEAKVEISTAEVENNTGWMYAIAQAFGEDVDKKTTESVIEYANSILAKSDEELVEHARSGKISHLGQAVAALSAIREYRRAKEAGEETYSTTLTAEYDGLTNGFAFRLMQFPIGNYKQWLPKVGVVTADSEYYGVETAAEIKAAGEADTYETQGKGHMQRVNEGLLDAGADVRELHEMIEQLGNMFDEVDGKVASEVRKLMKTPTMTFNYAAGFEAIKRAVANEMIDKLIGKLLEKREGRYVVSDEAVNKILGIQYGGRRMLLSKSMKSAEMAAVKNRLENYYKSTHGKAIEQSLNENFGAYVVLNKTINNTFTMMYKVLNSEYQAKKNDPKYATAEGRIQLIKELLDIGPAIEGPDSTNMDEYVLVLGRMLEDGDKTVQTHVNDATVKTRTTQTVVRGITDPGASGAVIPIHNMDGATIMRVIIEHKVLGVHDAMVIGVGQMGAIGSYNKNWYELNRDYSIMEKIVEAYDRSYAVGRGKGLKVGEGKNAMTMDQLRVELHSQAAAVARGREELFGQDMKIGQMVGPAGTMYEVSVKEELDRIQEEKIKIKEKLMEQVSKLPVALQRKIKDIAKDGGCL